MTMISDAGSTNPTSWDPHLTQVGQITSIYINPYIDWYAYGDIDKYGPRGSNATAFQLPQYIPDAYLTGGLAQSWELSANPLSLTVTIKKGIMWTGNAKIGMQAREVTADDCAFSGTRAIAAPARAGSYTWVKDCVAVDRYTFRWDFITYNANWEYYLFWGAGSATAIPPEMANAPNGGAANWQNAVGTGPFIIADFVDGSSVTYKRNPNYWGTTTINGQQYKLPFIDSLAYLIIPDPSTQLAGLRTGKIELDTQVPYTQGATLKQQAPDMIQKQWLYCSVDTISFNRLSGTPALGNLAVRQALMKATDFNNLLQLVYGAGDVLGWPVARGNPSYTPLENQPAAVQDLFTYDSTKAKQMLSDAGYPTGFTTTITIDSSIPQQTTEATILASQWAKVGVTLQIAAVNAVALTSQKNSLTFKGLLVYAFPTANLLTPLNYFKGITVYSIYKIGEPLDLAAMAIVGEQDPVKAQVLSTQFCKDALLDAGFIPMANPDIILCYWPWLKNYYGETDAAYHNQIPMIARMWIDQNLKRSLGK
jgi:peptide/nickel transport system substrate-binding protein